jgi:hypothetical protein
LLLLLPLKQNGPAITPGHFAASVYTALKGRGFSRAATHRKKQGL